MNIIAWNEERLTDLVTFWNKELGSDFPMREKLFKQNSFDDVNVSQEGSFIAVDDDNGIIGFVVTKQWKEDIDVGMDITRGWIQALLVDHTKRRQGIGTALYEQAVSHLKENGMKEIQLGGDPFHYFPGIPTQYSDAIFWAEKLGYEKRIDTYDLVSHLDKPYPFPQDEKVTFSILKQAEEQDLISFMNRCFPGRWTYEVMKYFDLNGDGREFVVARKNGKIIGFCRMNDRNSPFIAQNVYWSPLFDQEVGGIGPLGIDEREQKQGYGLAIIQAAMAFLQERNIKTIVIDWTILIDFYAKLGFKPFKEYGIYLKKVEE